MNTSHFLGCDVFDVIIIITGVSAHRRVMRLRHVNRGAKGSWFDSSPVVVGELLNVMLAQVTEMFGETEFVETRRRMSKQVSKGARSIGANVLADLLKIANISFGDLWHRTGLHLCSLECVNTLVESEIVTVFVVAAKELMLGRSTLGRVTVVVLGLRAWTRIVVVRRIVVVGFVDRRRVRD